MRAARRSSGGATSFARSLALAALAGAAHAPALAAQEPPPLVTDRPDFTESALTVPTALAQLEGGYTFTRAGGANAHALGEVLLRVGVHRRLELRLAGNSYVVEDVPGTDAFDADGFENPALGLKVGLFGGAVGDAPVDVALLGMATLPVGDTDVAPDRTEPELRLAVAGERWHTAWGLNLGWARTADELDQGLASFSLGRSIAERAGAYAEVFGTRDERGAEAYVNGGLTYLLAPALQLDARAGVGLTDLAADLFLGIGLSARW